MKNGVGYSCIPIKPHGSRKYQDERTNHALSAHTHRHHRLWLAYTRAYVSDVPGLNIFTRSDGTVRHFWSAEMAAPGQDPRGAQDVDPLWTILDLTPTGRGATWYPKFEYASLTTIK